MAHAETLEVCFSTAAHDDPIAYIANFQFDVSKAFSVSAKYVSHRRGCIICDYDVSSTPEGRLLDFFGALKTRQFEAVAIIDRYQIAYVDFPSDLVPSASTKLFFDRPERQLYSRVKGTSKAQMARRAR